MRAFVLCVCFFPAAVAWPSDMQLPLPRQADLASWFALGGVFPCEVASCCQIYNAAAVELAKTCPVCLHALEDFNKVYAGTPLSDALVKYGNSTLNLLRVANATLSSQREPGSAGLSAMASNASLLLRTAGASSGRGRLRLSCLLSR